MNDNDVWTRMMMDFIESRAGRALMEMTEEERKEFRILSARKEFRILSERKEFKEVKKCDFVKVIGDK